MNLFIEIIFVIVIILLIIFNLLVSLYAKLVKEDNKLSGFEVAKIVAGKVCLKEPHIIKKKGNKLDYYDLNRNVIKLSPRVFDGTSLWDTYVAFNVAYSAHPENKERLKIRKMLSFLVLISYIIIIMGAFLNNAMFIHFGMVLFIAAVLTEFFLVRYCSSQYKTNEFRMFVKSTKVLSDYNKMINELPLYNIIYIVNLPYRFITFFR